MKPGVAVWFAWAPALVLAAAPRPHPGDDPARHLWLDNGTVRLGCDLGFGGAITWFSLSDGPNVINNHDAGRQVQMSFYSGPVPYAAAGQEPAPHWRHLGWNPIQCGDDFGNGSRVLRHETFPEGSPRPTGLRLRVVPLQWPLDAVEADCEFVTGIELHGATAAVRCRLETHRSDRTRYPARHQELPAVYTVGRFHRLVTYTGDRPFTGAPPAVITGRPEGTHPWHFWSATERWAALVDDAGWGLGVWNPGCVHFTGGFAGSPGSPDTRAAATGYLAPLRTEELDAAMTYEFSYDLVLGTVEEIRAHVARRHAPAPAPPPAWTFDASREGWHASGRPIDAGWPVSGRLVFPEVPPGTQLFSPETFWRAEDAPAVVLRFRFPGSVPAATGRLRFRRHGERGFAPDTFLPFAVESGVPDQEFRLDLAAHPAYRGGMLQIALDLPEVPCELDAVVLGPPSLAP
jgi:hypothetical protein